MITDDSRSQPTSITMELHGMRHFFIVIVFTVCLFITITSLGVFKTYSNKLIGPSINHEKDRELRRRGIDPFMLHNKFLHARSLSGHKLKTSELQTQSVPHQRQIKNDAKSYIESQKMKRKEESDTKHQTKSKKLHTEKRNSVPVKKLDSATQTNHQVTVNKTISWTKDRDLHSSETSGITQSVSQTTDSERLKSIGSKEISDRFGTYRRHKISKDKHTKPLKFIPLTKAKKNNSRISLDFNNPRFKPLKKNNYNNGLLSSKGELKFRSMHNRLENMSRSSFRNNASENISRHYGHAFNKTEKYNFSDTSSIYSRRRFIPPGMADSHPQKNLTNRNQAQPSYVLKYKPLINENKDNPDIKDERGHRIEEFKRTEK
ncbi:uncharacterized protein LOC126816514 [Patella vulgata]|uniref:uncharacterized protein LOC126816514 n=1 Tax=Patella vulgata TaxID=6465 RepID=UPI00218061B5|nr:uncharacterized protein LOC126816514 [Patella vulgata]XP_050399075.1 uncharacterized protein LOC126816514 [Patella vulgata]XP_050399076.1 uncharacterized protein LOC126816514 [Patella vulgata]XP_050399077.1 uncharacterized protein LOC126816514 [Patella vulgata]XP_050399078.1 uncharacterized protein LOC126816514 [Patella vulgata]